MVSGKRPEYQQKRILDLSFLFTIKNVAPDYALCQLEICFFLLYGCYKIVTQKSLVYPVNCNIEKDTTLNTKVLKRGGKAINIKMT